MTKKIISAALVVAIIVLSYFVYNSIRKPILFQKEKDKRYAEVIQRLKDIRTAEIAFFDKYQHYTADFDSLMNFMKFDSLPIVMAIGTVPDTLTEEQALALNLITRDTVNIAVSDTIRLIGKVDSMKFVPYSFGALFKLDAGTIMTGSKVKVNVFEAYDSKPFDPTDVKKVGSMIEATTSGNWE